MDMKTYMDQDLHRIENTVKELSANITHWDTDKVFEKAKEMFDAFSQRFSLEDHLLCQLIPSAEISRGIQKFLKRRMVFRTALEDILFLHADEPDFRKKVSEVIEMVEKHIKYREEEFYPQVISRLESHDFARMKKALEMRVHISLT